MTGYVCAFQYSISLLHLTSLQDGNPVPVEPSGYFFGPVSLDLETVKNQSNPTFDTDELATDQPATTTKATADTNGHSTTAATATASERDQHRKVNGEGVEIDVNGTTAVSVDEAPPSPSVDRDGDVNMDGAVAPEDQEQTEPPPPVFTLTNGTSVAVQMTPAKAADLRPNTTIVDVAVHDHVASTMWRPHDPTVMVAVGETFASLCKLSPSSANPVQEVLYDDSHGDLAGCVSAVAWDPTGQKLAVATYSDMKGSITMYDVDGDAVDMLPEVPRMITGLYWSQQSSHLVVVASDSKVSELALWDNSHRPDEFPSPQVIERAIYDFAWLDHNRAYACGDGSVYQLDVDSNIRVSRVFSEEENGGVMTSWTYVRSTQRNSTPVVVAAATEPAKIWIPTHDMSIKDAHQGEITAIEFRPEGLNSGNAPLILASSSTDDTVKIWHVNLESKRLECIHRLFLGVSMPALASSFSPDGYAIAAGSEDKVLVWNADRGGEPMATWTAPSLGQAEEEPKPVDGPYHEHEHDGKNGSAELMPVRSLSWDADGKKLAFGFDSQVPLLFPLLLKAEEIC